MSANHLGTVLILEDDPGVNRLQCRKLERSGYAVASSGTTDEALEKIQAGGIDLIVLDYSLSGAISGVEFYRRLQIGGFDLPAILVTGFSDEGRLIEALRAGVRDFLPKTADFIDYLPQTVERVMKQVRAERKANESEKLRQKEERFRTSVENMLDGFGIYSAVRDEAGRITDLRVDYLNAAAGRLNGRGAEEQIGGGLLTPGSSTDFERTLFERGARVVETGAPFSADGLLVEGKRRGDEADGGGEACQRWFDVRITKLADGVVATWRDATERIRSESEIARAKLRAEQASRAKDEFLASVSHELRTPLNAILGWVQLLGIEDLDAATKRDAVLTIERNAKSQARLIEDLIDISRIVSGKLRLELRPMELPGVLRAAVEASQPAARARSLELETEMGGLSAPFVGDAERVQQIAWNLITNAVKFTSPGGRVRVALRELDGARVEISVADTGKGIAPAYLPLVFERFSQADSSSTRQHSGLGLGLAITRHMVELHGGTIEAASEGEGRGATFTVRLPLRSAVPVDQPEAGNAETRGTADGSPAPLPRDLDGVRIVAVDDDADARLILETVLTYCHADVTVVANAEAAFQAVRERRPDVLLSDVEMAGEDGYGLIRRVRALGPEEGGNTPAAALTAYARAEDQRRVLDAGFQMHVAKPLEATRLVAVVKQLARRGSAD